MIGLVAVSHGVVFIRLAGEAPALLIALGRVAVATLVFWPLGVRASARVDLASERARRAVLVSGVAGVFLALHFASWIASLERISIAESTVLVSLTPVWVAIIDALAGRGAPTRALLAAIGLCLAGTTVLAADSLRTLGGDPAGLLLAALGGVFMALYLVAGRSARATLPTPLYVTACYGAAAAVLAAAVAALGVPVSGHAWTTWAAIAALGLVSQVVGHTAYNWTLATLPPVMVAICLLGEPVLGSVLGWLYLGEAVPPAAALGGVLILAGIFLAIRDEARRN